MFVAEIAAPARGEAADAGEQNVAAVGAKFQEVMAELKRRKLGNRKFLRDMPWYVIVGPPATGKTTALRQSGLNFPIDLTDDLQGVGGTRNCDWFFTEDAVLIDTAGRYVQQESQPDVDAAEWLGFLDLLKKHRGRRALNGVIVALVDRRAARKATRRSRRMAARSAAAWPSCNERLQIRLPVYLMLTKADLIKGFEPFFGNLSTADREQVWGVDLPARRQGRCGRRSDSEIVAARDANSKSRLVPRLETEDTLAERAEIFRFPGSGRKPRRADPGAGRCDVRREPLRGERLAARHLSDLGDPGRRADRPADRGARRRPSACRRGAPCRPSGSKSAASS